MHSELNVAAQIFRRMATFFPAWGGEDFSGLGKRKGREAGGIRRRRSALFAAAKQGPGTRRGNLRRCPRALDAKSVSSSVFFSLGSFKICGLQLLEFALNILGVDVTKVEKRWAKAIAVGQHQK